MLILIAWHVTKRKKPGTQIMQVYVDTMTQKHIAISNEIDEVNVSFVEFDTFGHFQKTLVLHNKEKLQRLVLKCRFLMTLLITSTDRCLVILLLSLKMNCELKHSQLKILALKLDYQNLSDCRFNQ